MAELHLKYRFTYSACRPFTKTKKRIQKFKETRDTKYIHRKKWEKARFQHNIAYGDFKNLERRTQSDKDLRDKALNEIRDNAKNPKYDRYQRGLAFMVYNFFDKRSKGSGFNNEIKQNERPFDFAVEQLAEELHQSIIRKF